MTRVMTGVRFGICVMAVAVGAVVIRGQQPPAAAPVNLAQVAAGRQIYQTNCASCHRADLSGAAEAPALAGPNFTRVWGSRTAAQLAAYIQAAMPPTGRRATAQEAEQLAAFILQSNVASGGAAPQAATPPAAGPRVGTQFPPGRGLTVAGEVPNYVPVTDAMLRNPPEGDWLMIRRNYQAWSHSPLTEITPANVTAPHRVGLGDDRGRGERTDPDRP